MLCPITVQVSEGSALEDYNSPGPDPHRTGVSSYSKCKVQVAKKITTVQVHITLAFLLKILEQKNQQPLPDSFNSAVTIDQILRNGASCT